MMTGVRGGWGIVASAIARRRAAGVVILAVTGVVVAVGAVQTSAPAQSVTGADSGAVSVSPDGQAFTRTFSGLFDGVILVPRGASEETFFLRNTATESGYLHVGLTDVGASSPDMREGLSVQIGLPGQVSEEVSLEAGEQCVSMIAGAPVSGMKMVPIHARIVLGDLIGTEAQDQSVTFSLRFVMTKEPAADGCIASPPTGTPTSPPSARPPALGGTGAAIPVLVAAVGVGLVATGTAALLSRRKRSKDAE